MAETASDVKTAAAPAKARDVVTADFLRTILDALERDGTALKRIVEPLHPADVAQLLGAMDAADRREFVAKLGSDFDPEILSELDEDLRTELVRMLGSKSLAEAVIELDVEDAAYVLEDLEDAEKREVLAQVPLEDRAQVVDALMFPEDSAGRRLPNLHRMVHACAGKAFAVRAVGDAQNLVSVAV